MADHGLILIGISIHALREEGDRLRLRLCSAERDFYPRPPRGGRLARLKTGSMPSYISIHALREEGDLRYARNGDPLLHFYPRPPRGGRPVSWPASLMLVKFLSTPSARRATGVPCFAYIRDLISIHALREEGDLTGS